MTREERNAMIDGQIQAYQRQIFQIEMHKTALLANEDADGAKVLDSRIEALRKAISAVEGMREAG